MQHPAPLCLPSTVFHNDQLLFYAGPSTLNLFTSNVCLGTGLFIHNHVSWCQRSGTSYMVVIHFCMVQIWGRELFMFPPAHLISHEKIRGIDHRQGCRLWNVPWAVIPVLWNTHFRSSIVELVHITREPFSLMTFTVVYFLYHPWPAPCVSCDRHWALPPSIHKIKRKAVVALVVVLDQPPFR